MAEAGEKIHSQKIALMNGKSSSIPRAYLDTCVISGLVEEDLKSKDQVAVREMMGLVQESRLTVCTSTEARGELLDLEPQERRQQHMQAYDEIQTLKREADWLDPEEPFTPEAMQILGRLREVLPDEMDARHIAHAAMHGVNDFVTSDYRTILSRAGEVEEVSGVSVWSPREYHSSLTSRGAST